MGMYTSLELNCEMRDKPQLMDHLLGFEDVVGAEFECNVLNSCYNNNKFGKPHSEFYQEDGFYYLTIRASVKYQYYMIVELIQYLHMHMEHDDGDCIGILKQEEDELPTLLIYRDDYIEFKEVE